MKKCLLDRNILAPFKAASGIHWIVLILPNMLLTLPNKSGEINMDVFFQLEHPTADQ